MLRIHNGLQKCSKTNLFDLHINKINPFGIHEPFIKIARNELLFEIYRMALKQDKCNIEVRNYDAIKRNRILFDFVQRTFNGLYLRTVLNINYTKYNESLAVMVKQNTVDGRMQKGKFY